MLQQRIWCGVAVVLGAFGCAVDRQDLSTNSLDAAQPQVIAAEVNVRSGQSDTDRLRVSETSEGRTFWTDRHGAQVFRGRVIRIEAASGALVYADSTPASASFLTFAPNRAVYTALDSSARGFAPISAIMTNGRALPPGTYEATVELYVVGTARPDLTDARSIFLPLTTKLRVIVTE